MSLIDRAMTGAALFRAKLRVYNVCCTGQIVTIVNPATKDEFGSLLTESTQDFYAFPVKFNPYDRKTEDKVSWSEDTDILCYISKKEVDDLGLNIEKLRRSKKLRHANKTYDLKYIELYNPFGTDFLYVVLGGKK
jgi:hypothetical protein